MSSNTNRGNVFGFATSDYKEKLSNGYFQKTYTMDHNIWYTQQASNTVNVRNNTFQGQTGGFWEGFFK